MLVPPPATPTVPSDQLHAHQQVIAFADRVLGLAHAPTPPWRAGSWHGLGDLPSQSSGHARDLEHLVGGPLYVASARILSMPWTILDVLLVFPVVLEEMRITP